jgi:rSAM-associated Gly-rich repeat protein
LKNPTFQNRTSTLLSYLLPAGVLGVSMALASSASALPISPEGVAAASGQKPSVAERLKAIRDGVSEIAGQPVDDNFAQIGEGFPNVLKAYWRNFRNGGWRPRWRNGGWGWRNGGWRHGWRNGGGWRNFRNW